MNMLFTKKTNEYAKARGRVYQTLNPLQCWALGLYGGGGPRLSGGCCKVRA